MELIILGLLIWSGVHMVPVALPNVRSGLVAKMGEMPFKGIFSLTIFASIALIVFGWRSIDSVTLVYETNTWASFAALLMLIFGFILMAASAIKSNFQRTFRHPQLTGFTLWAVAHLLLNGDLRTTILFGGMAAWAVLTMVLLNKRDGVFEKPKKQLPHQGVITVAVGFVVFILVALAHEYIAGVNITQKG